MNTDSETVDRMIKKIIFTLIGILVVIPLYKKAEPCALYYLGINQNSGLGMDGIVTAIIALIGIWFIYTQIQQKIRIERFNNLTNRTISALDNIRCNKIQEGYYAYSMKNSVRYVVCWRVDYRKGLETEQDLCNFDMIFRIVNKRDDFSSVMSELCDSSNRERWSFHTTISFRNGCYGEIIQASNLGYGIEKMSRYEYSCIMHALFSIQLFDQSELILHQNQLRMYSIKQANDDYLKVGIAERSSIYSGFT